MQHKTPLTYITAILTALLLTIPLAAAQNNGITITNLTQNTINLTYDQLKALPKTIVNSDLYCYGNLVTSGDWGGVH